MKIISIIYDLVYEKIKNIPFDEVMLADGMKKYAEDNHLIDWEATVNDETVVKEMMGDFLKPILRMSPEGLADYFEYYSVHQKFMYLNQAILDMAEAVYYENPVEDVGEKEKVLIELSTQLHKSRTLKEAIDIAVSEALLNIDYIRGNRSDLSMSLAKRVNF